MVRYAGLTAEHHLTIHQTPFGRAAICRYNLKRNHEEALSYLTLFHHSMKERSEFQIRPFSDEGSMTAENFVRVNQCRETKVEYFVLQFAKFYS